MLKRLELKGLGDLERGFLVVGGGRLGRVFKLPATPGGSIPLKNFFSGDNAITKEFPAGV